MPFKFQWLCELLDRLEQKGFKKSATASRAYNPDHDVIKSWFNQYEAKIERQGASAVALLSALFPERRVDRVYALQETRLAAIFGRALGLGHTRARDLDAWSRRDGADFATCVEQVMSQCEFDVPELGNEVTVEEIDICLHQIAANSPYSSPAVKKSRNGASADQHLTPILRRLQSHEAKWFVRMILKAYDPVQVPEYLTMWQFHFMLPKLLEIQNSLDAAIKTLNQASIRMLPPRPALQYERALGPLLAREISPCLGTMIRRQPYHKARSIKHCCQIANQRQMSVERKYDGEYCQVHVNISKGHDCIQIFSKSGRDSTSDRARLHGVIKECLRIHQNGCRVRKQCIIEGELFIWSNTRKEALPFHKIRKHVKHGGRYLGAANDSPRKPDEQLMMAVYDILVLDDKLLLQEPHHIRRRHLKAVLSTAEGRCILGERHIIDFASSRASRKLRAAFARAISQRWEGFVLKACNEPYFSWGSANHGIKLKKDYIAGLGDTAEICIVGGRRDARAEQEINLGNLRWTSFHVGCLTNKDDVKRFGSMPKIKIIDELTHHSMPISELKDLNQLGHLREIDDASNNAYFDLEDTYNVPPPTELFSQPFVVEIMGAGFERLSDSSFYTLRFPRKIDGKIKIHDDRALSETISFQELQEMAKRSLRVAHQTESQEDAQWIKGLLQAEGRSHSTQDRTQETTPGKSPLSMIAATPSPASVKAAAPQAVFIRADTEELSDVDMLESHCVPHGTPASVIATRSHSRSLVEVSSSHQSGMANTTQPRRHSNSKFAARNSQTRSPVAMVDLTTSPLAQRSIEHSNFHFQDHYVQILGNFISARASVSSSHMTMSTNHEVSKSNEPLAHATIFNASQTSVTSTRTYSELTVQGKESQILGQDRTNKRKVDPNHTTKQSRKRAKPSPSLLQVAGLASSPRSPAKLKPFRIDLNPAHHDATKTTVWTSTSPIPPLDPGLEKTATCLAGSKKSHGNINALVGPIYVLPSVLGQMAVCQKVFRWAQALGQTYTTALDAFLDSMDYSSSARSYHIVLADVGIAEPTKQDLDIIVAAMAFRQTSPCIAAKHEMTNVHHTSDGLHNKVDSTEMRCPSAQNSATTRKTVEQSQVVTSHDQLKLPPRPDRGQNNDRCQRRCQSRYHKRIMIWDWSMLKHLLDTHASTNTPPSSTHTILNDASTHVDASDAATAKPDVLRVLSEFRFDPYRKGLFAGLVKIVRRCRHLDRDRDHDHPQSRTETNTNTNINTNSNENNNENNNENHEETAMRYWLHDDWSWAGGRQ